ncbi:YihY/virulence factor BrkB family protein [Lentilactobacillus laojiaonis]|uniref:YihY/virulence factor BrkB family protein n=1 Tax=Lentilactobacillus laojiaonis TaxID=2883998 RepID=UPI001D0AFCF7|nr:YihY/virulence factor BrkB family protein [Lentilactobacillus laojiaonis]UDM32436.1 YihY/virulence factor BrkB family protein [Lentilactobacillus laojiaonis]
MLKNNYLRAKRYVQSFLKHYKNGNVSDSAAALSFYLLFALFPLIIIFGSVLQIMNLHANEILLYLEPIFPDSIFSMLKPVINSTIHGYSTGQLSIGLLVTIWSASRAIAAFQRSINQSYDVAKNQTAISNRIISFVWMLALLVFVVLMILIFIFGQWILVWIKPIINFPKDWIEIFSAVKWPTTIMVILILLTLLFYFVPNAKVKFRYAWIGALFSSLGILLLAQGFSIYIKYFASGITTYKTIGTFIALMFWLDLSALILLIGGVINATIQEVRQGEIQEQQDALERVVQRARQVNQAIKHNNKKNND